MKTLFLIFAITLAVMLCTIIGVLTLWIVLQGIIFIKEAIHELKRR